MYIRLFSLRLIFALSDMQTLSVYQTRGVREITCNVYDEFVTYPAVTPTRIEKPTAKGDRWCSSCSSSVVIRTVRTTRTVIIPSANNPHPGSVSFKRVVDPPRLETYIFGGKIACVHKTGVEIKVGWI